jgi:chromosome segregation ATPase
MSSDAPDRPLSFARLQQQLILTEVELMKLEDLRDGLQTRVETADRLRLDMQRLADQACAERDHLGRHAADLEVSLRHTQEQLAREQAVLAGLKAKAESLAAELSAQQVRAAELAANLAAMESSASWRWTAPLRRLFGRR